MPVIWGSFFTTIFLVLLLCLYIIYVVRAVDMVSFGCPYGDVGPSDGAFLIVEPRPHHLLGTVITEFSKRVPPSWVLYVVHGERNAEYARAAAARVSGQRRVVFIPLDIDDLKPSQYNTLFKTPEFWHQVQAEHILVFQTDAMPCGPPLDMERYGEFGYIGCAYGNKVGANSYWQPNTFYGVGGLSLRRKSFMLECLKKPGTHDAEDVTFSNCVDDYESRPTAQDVGDFCAETGWGDPLENPQSWGAHKIGLMDSKKRQQFLKYCPAAGQIT